MVCCGLRTEAQARSFSTRVEIFWIMGTVHDPGVQPLRARVTFVTVEHGLLHASGYSLHWERETGTVVIPVGMATVILIEPGVNVTHAAVKLCADQGTLLLWVGEAGVRIYSAGLPGGAAGERIRQQAALRLNPKHRIAVARRFYERMFGELPPPANDIAKLRGIEGVRVKRWYQDIADQAGVSWDGRERSPKALRDAIGYATATLYGISYSSRLRGSK